MCEDYENETNQQTGVESGKKKEQNMKNQDYIVEFLGEPVTRLHFQRDGKADLSTGDIADALRYTEEEADSCAAAIGRGAAAVMEKKSYSEIKNELASKHGDRFVEVKTRCTGQVRERLVSDLISEAERQDAWFNSEPEQRTVKYLNEFLCDYQISW